MKFDRLPIQSSIRDALASTADAARRTGVRVDPVEAPSDLPVQHRTWVNLYAAARAAGSGWRTNAALVRRQQRARLAWDELLQRHDAILLPATMCVAFGHRPTGRRSR